MYRASIAIFRNDPEFGYEDASRPIVPDSIFEVAQRVIESKGCEFIKSHNGVFIVRYAEHGPYQSHVSDEWLPVYIARVEKWSSGGIKRSEFENFIESESLSATQKEEYDLFLSNIRDDSKNTPPKGNATHSPA